MQMKHYLIIFSPESTFRVIVMIHARFRTRWAATKNPSARPDQSCTLLICAIGSTRVVRPNNLMKNANLNIPVIKLIRKKIPIPISTYHLTTCMFMTVTPSRYIQAMQVKGDGTCVPEYCWQFLPLPVYETIIPP